MSSEAHMENSHTEIQEIFPDIFFVMGVNKTQYNGIELQHSRNMVIVRNNNKLSLINTVQLTDDGLTALDKLGTVENIIRLGAFHGRDDAFYLARYPSAKLWAIKGMEHANDKLADHELTPDGELPFKDCAFILFETALFPEGVLLLKKHDGILITCDSIKNWLEPDAFFSKETAALYQKKGFFGCASISKVWQQAMDVQATDMQKLTTLKFKHLISAHGQPLLNHADEHVTKSIKQEFNV